jgi:hypothetical protein
MAIKAPRILPRLLLWSLIIYVLCCQAGWAEWPFHISRQFVFLLINEGPTLLVIGIASISFIILLYEAGKRAAASVDGINASTKDIGTAIANSLTRYQAKHPLTPQHNTLTLNLSDFESALLHKLPKEARKQSCWWTDVSAHSQQWLAQGWQVLDTKLTDSNPHVVFSFNLPPIEELLAT